MQALYRAYRISLNSLRFPSV